MINGKYYDWEDVSINFAHGPLIDVQSIEYSDEQETEEVYGKGSKPRGYGHGNYKASGKVTFTREEYDRLIVWAKTQGRPLYDLNYFNATVSFADDGTQAHTDTLQECKFNKRSFKAKQGDKKNEVDLDIAIIGGIKSDDYEA